MMTDDIFRRKRVRTEALEGYGFRRSPEGWRYSETFMDGEFSAEILIGEDGRVTGKVMDLSSGEEYLPIYQQTPAGEFAGRVRESYAGILEKTAAACFSDRPFVSDQANRLCGAILEIYSERPDYPFGPFPEPAVFRYQGNRRWYGIVMYISKHLLTREEKKEDTPMAEVINLKADAERVPDLLKREGIYPAYHMNHKNWISVILDGTVDDRLILSLIDESRRFAVSSGGKTRTGPLNWIVPANPRYYDVEKAFSERDEILWKQGRGIIPGDTVYLYVGSPVSAVRYRCVVTEAMIPSPYRDGNVSMTHVMRIRKTAEYRSDVFPLGRLRELGVKMLRGPSRAPESFTAEAEKTEQ
ncbi:MAG: MmcQ/YjbR family DNA-binding protein [Clostridia bacterium]|nr:MmcQ/YjbR family DNA-binding protein [Clostridia bacterium]